MANVKKIADRMTASLTVNGKGKGATFVSNKKITDVLDHTMKVHHDDNSIDMFSLAVGKVASGDETTTAGQVENFKYLVISNPSSQTIEVSIEVPNWSTGTKKDGYDSASTWINTLLPANDFIVVPNARIVNYTADNSAGNALIGYLRDGAAKDEDANYEYPGQVHVLDGIAADSTYNNGVVAFADISDKVTNSVGSYNLLTDVSLDNSDWDENFLGKATYDAPLGSYKLAGIVPGSIAIRFQEPPYQELGVKETQGKAITVKDDSKLTANTSYKFKIAIDGGVAQELTITTSSTTTWGGNNGIIKKIQDALDAEVYDSSSNLYKLPVKCKLIDGDIRFTGPTAKAAAGSAVVLTDGSSSTLFGNGWIPAQASLPANVQARFPSLSEPQKIMFDDGLGNLSRASGGAGTIDYTIGTVTLKGCPPNSEMEVVLSTDGALGGNLVDASQSDRDNYLVKVVARSTNILRDGYCRIIAFN